MKKLGILLIVLTLCIVSFAVTPTASKINFCNGFQLSGNPEKDNVLKWAKAVEVLINAGALSSDGNTVTFNNGGTVSNSTDGVLKFGETSEDLLLTFTSNTGTFTSSTGLTSLGFTGITPSFNSGVLGTEKIVTTTTTPVAVTAANSGAVYVSYGVAATAANCVFTLPTAAAGLTYTFVDANATAADDLWVTAAAGDAINGGTAAKSFKNTGDVYGASVVFIAIDATNWIAMPGAIGTWANDNN